MLPLIRRRSTIRRWARERQEKGENRRPILKRLRAAFLGSFRGQQSKKMACVREVAGVTRTLGKTKAILTQTKGGRGLHRHVEAAVDCCKKTSHK